MIRHLLDTDACIDLIRRRSPAFLRRLERRPAGTVGISSVTFAELRYGIARSSDPARNLAALLLFCAPLEVLPFDTAAGSAYGDLRAGLERQGAPIGPLDTLIAAHALSRDLKLVTGNEREFRRVPGLNVESWRPPHRPHARWEMRASPGKPRAHPPGLPGFCGETALVVGSGISKRTVGPCRFAGSRLVRGAGSGGGVPGT